MRYVSKCIPKQMSSASSWKCRHWGLTHLLHSELHWLDVLQRILHKLGVTVHRCLQGRAPQYLMNTPPHIGCCQSSATLMRLWSSSRHQLVVPRHRRSTFGCRTFYVAGPMAWNALPDDLRDLLWIRVEFLASSFCQSLLLFHPSSISSCRHKFVKICHIWQQRRTCVYMVRWIRRLKYKRFKSLNDNVNSNRPQDDQSRDSSHEYQEHRWVGWQPPCTCLDH